jgi:hypothetical protein
VLIAFYFFEVRAFSRRSSWARQTQVNKRKGDNSWAHDGSVSSRGQRRESSEFSGSLKRTIEVASSTKFSVF